MAEESDNNHQMLRKRKLVNICTVPSRSRSTTVAKKTSVYRPPYMEPRKPTMLLDLSNEILLIILSKVSLIDIVFGVRRTCHTLRALVNHILITTPLIRTLHPVYNPEPEDVTNLSKRKMDHFFKITRNVIHEVHLRSKCTYAIDNQIRDLTLTLHSCRKIKHFHLKWIGEKFPVDAVGHLLQFADLESLTMETAFSAVFSQRMPTIRALTMRNINNALQFEYTPDNGTPNLEVLNLQNYKLHIEGLGNLPHLKKLSMTRCDLFGVDLFKTVFSELQNLTSIKMAHMLVAVPLDITHLSMLPNLTKVHLEGEEFRATDFLLNMCDKDQLTEVKLIHTNVSQAVLQQFAKMKNMSMLYLQCGAQAYKEPSLVALNKNNFQYFKMGVLDINQDCLDNFFNTSKNLKRFAIGTLETLNCDALQNHPNQRCRLAITTTTKQCKLIHNDETFSKYHPSYELPINCKNT